MGAALSVVDIIAKAQHIFMKLIYILKCALHRDAFRFAFKINDIVNRLAAFVHIFDKAHNALRLMVLDMFCFRASLILIDNRKLRV